MESVWRSTKLMTVMKKSSERMSQRRRVTVSSGGAAISFVRG